MLVQASANHTPRGCISSLASWTISEDGDQANYNCVLNVATFDEETCAPPDPCPDTGDTDDSLRWDLHLWVKRDGTFRLRGKCLQDWLAGQAVMRRPATVLSMYRKVDQMDVVQQTRDDPSRIHRRGATGG